MLSSAGDRRAEITVAVALTMIAAGAVAFAQVARAKRRRDRVRQALAGLSPLQRRMVGCVVGSCVADAAARPLHWIYSRERMASLLKQGARDAAFFPRSCSPFYTLPTGRRSCYGEEVVVGLRALQPAGAFDRRAFLLELERTFGEGTEWARALELRGRMRGQYRGGRDRASWSEPVPGPWLNGSVISALEQWRAHRDLEGAAARRGEPAPAAPEATGHPELCESDGLCAALPVVALLARIGAPDAPADARAAAEAAVRDAVSMLSASPTSVEYALAAAQLLWGVLAGGSLERAAERFVHSGPGTEAARDRVGEVLNAARAAGAGWDAHADAVHEWGKACSNPGSFSGGLHAALSSGGDFADAVRRTIAAGGCNCSRAVLCGALLGAAGGVEAIPEDWLGRADDAVDVLEWTARLVRHPSSL